MRTQWQWGALIALMMIGNIETSSAAQKSGQGAHLYHQYCAGCHGEKGLGNGPVAPYLTVKPADLTRISARRDGQFPRAQLTHIIAGEEAVPAHGTRTMPIWGERLQDDVIGGVSKPAVARGRIAFLVDFLETLQGTGEKGLDNIVIPGRGPRPGLGPQP